MVPFELEVELVIVLSLPEAVMLTIVVVGELLAGFVMLRIVKFELPLEETVALIPVVLPLSEAVTLTIVVVGELLAGFVMLRIVEFELPLEETVALVPFVLTLTGIVAAIVFTHEDSWITSSPAYNKQNEVFSALKIVVKNLMTPVTIEGVIQVKLQVPLILSLLSKYNELAFLESQSVVFQSGERDIHCPTVWLSLLRATTRAASIGTILVILTSLVVAGVYSLPPLTIIKI